MIIEWGTVWSQTVDGVLSSEALSCSTLVCRRDVNVLPLAAICGVKFGMLTRWATTRCGGVLWRIRHSVVCLTNDSFIPLCLLL